MPQRSTTGHHHIWRPSRPLNLTKGKQPHLVSLDGSDFLVGLDVVALLLQPLFESTLGDGLGHGGDFDDLLSCATLTNMVDESGRRRKEGGEKGRSVMGEVRAA
jgi:hypothetical protein